MNSVSSLPRCESRWARLEESVTLPQLALRLLELEAAVWPRHGVVAGMPLEAAVQACAVLSGNLG